jgi:hypothetical protein
MFGFASCEQCKGKLTESLSKEQEEELTSNIIAVLKKYPISYVEAYRVLDCAESKLNVMSRNLQL